MWTLNLDEFLWRIVKTEDGVCFLISYLTVYMRSRGLVGTVRFTQQTAGVSGVSGPHKLGSLCYFVDILNAFVNYSGDLF